MSYRDVTSGLAELDISGFERLQTFNNSWSIEWPVKPVKIGPHKE